jgi:hypothetical protein
MKSQYLNDLLGHVDLNQLFCSYLNVFFEPVL